jgi:uncharacterized protein (DUF1697 family)
MHSYIALLRAVNVGGTGKLPMTDLQAMCRGAGFSKIRTYIASGNVVFQSTLNARTVKAELESRLLTYASKPVGVVVRTAAEMMAIERGNPFPKAAPNHTVAIFLDEPPAPDALAHAVGLKGEEMRLGLREIYVSYGAGMSRSNLKIPAAKAGTARNFNTISKLAKMAAEL